MALAATAVLVTSAALAPATTAETRPDGTSPGVVASTAATSVRTAALSNYPVVGIGATGDTHGYWLVSSDGGVFSFGDARFYGSAAGFGLRESVVGMAVTRDGGGYWLVSSDGGVFSFGDARFYGSAGAVRLDQPVVGMATTSDGRGYWLAAADGGVFTYGDARFYGSAGAVRLDQPVVGMATTSDGRGYWLAAADGGVLSYGDAHFYGSAVDFNAGLGGRTVGMVEAEDGYWLSSDVGGLLSLDALLPPEASLLLSAPPDLSQPAQGPLPVGETPSESIEPSPAERSCWGTTPDVAACNSAALADIDRARGAEALGPLTLPSGFYTMNTDQQILAVANAERTSRGLPALPEETSLDALAQDGAVTGADPTGPSGYTWASNLSWGAATALAADFIWMYDDGPDSPNIDCPYAVAPGCWGHRVNILSPWAGASGAGNYNNYGVEQLTELFVAGY